MAKLAIERVGPTADVSEWTNGDQDRELLALRCFYSDSEKPCTRVHVRDGVEEPLEKTRLFGPFAADVVYWVSEMRSKLPNYVTIGKDADGRDYIQY